MSRPPLMRSTTVGCAAGTCTSAQTRVVARNEVSGPDEQPFAIRRQGHPTGRPDEQGRAELRLEPLDLATERLLGDEQARRGAREVELLRRRHEVAQGADLELVADRPAGSIHALLMVIGPRQVLDARAQASEGVSHEVLTQDVTTGDMDMFDHGAMGTLLIGLNAAQDETDTKRARGSVDRSTPGAIPSARPWRVASAAGPISSSRSRSASPRSKGRRLRVPQARSGTSV